MTTPQHTVHTNLPGKPISWAIDRDLTGSGVPGQARTRSGLATAGGTITLHNQSGQPWRPTINPNTPATINASTDTGQPSRRRFTGRTTSISAPSALATTLTLAISDNIPKGRKLTWNLPGKQPGIAYQDSTDDITALINHAAATLGYHTTPPPDQDTILSVPFQGSATPDRGTRYGTGIA